MNTSIQTLEDAVSLLIDEREKHAERADRYKAELTKIRKLAADRLGIDPEKVSYESIAEAVEEALGE